MSGGQILYMTFWLVALLSVGRNVALSNDTIRKVYLTLGFGMRANFVSNSPPGLCTDRCVTLACGIGLCMDILSPGVCKRTVVCHQD